MPTARSVPPPPPSQLMRERFLLFVPSESPALRNVLGGVGQEEEHVGREDLCWVGKKKDLLLCHRIITRYCTASLTGGTHQALLTQIGTSAPSTPRPWVT